MRIAANKSFFKFGSACGGGTRIEFLLIIAGLSGKTFIAPSGAYGAFSEVNESNFVFGNGGSLGAFAGKGGILDLYKSRIAFLNFICS